MAEVKEIENKAKQEENKDQAQPPRSISIEEVLGSYPVDREKVRDVLLIDISKSLIKIADSMPAITEALVLLGKKIEDGKKE
jgi:hypothetical protein